MRMKNREEIEMVNFVHPWDVKTEAEDLYVRSSLTLGQISEKLEVPEASMRRWSSSGHWSRKRENYNQLIRKTKFDLAELYGSMLEKAKETKAPEDVQAALLVKKALDEERPE